MNEWNKLSLSLLNYNKLNKIMREGGRKIKGK